MEFNINFCQSIKLRLSLAALLIAGIAAPLSYAQDFIVDAGDEAWFWTLQKGDKLTVLPGGELLTAELTDADLFMDGGKVAFQGSFNGEILLLRGSSNALLKNSLITAEENYSMAGYPALALGDEYSNTTNKATLINSQILSRPDDSGSSATIQLYKNSVLVLTNSVVSGSGIWSTDSRIYAQDSAISGVNSGVKINASESSGTLAEFRNTQITGIRGQDRLSGYALVVRATEKRGVVSVLLADGTTLYGGDDGSRLIDLSGNTQLNLSVDNAQLSGHMIVENPSSLEMSLQNNASFSGNFLKDGRISPGNINMSLRSGSRWQMTESESIGRLTLDNGSVVLSRDAPGEFNTLKVEKLSGQGQFQFRTDVAAAQSDRLLVSSTAEGQHLVSVQNSGKDPLTQNRLTLIETGGGNATFTLAGGAVDIGAWQYGLIRNGNDWELAGDSTGTINPSRPEPSRTSASTDAVINLTSAPQFLFYRELENLRSRRVSAPHESGVWGSFLSGTESVTGANDAGYKLVQSGMQLGADTVSETPWGDFVKGAFISNSSGKLKNARGGNSHLDSWGMGLYGSLLSSDGAYLSLTLQGNRFSSRLSTSMADGTPVNGKWQQYGFGVDSEAGITVPTGSAIWLQPYARLSGYYGQSKNVALSNDMAAAIGPSRSVRGEAGLRAGTTFSAAGMRFAPYVGAALVQEFTGHTNVTINDKNSFSNDFSGTSGRFAGGASLALSDAASVYAEAQYRNGHHVESPLSGTLGVRIGF